MFKPSGYEWLLIDAATQYGLDKLNFADRLDWAHKHLQELETLAETAETKTKPLYIKAVMAIRKAQTGKPTGHMVGVDGTCSGIQMMSVMTGCVAGARSTGLIDPGVRADAYSATTQAMNTILGGGLVVARNDAKKALMHTCYGSKKTPRDLFGENTPELAAFYQAVQIIAPGAWDLLQVLLASWKPYALSHEWKLPDGFDAVVKVMVPKEIRIEVDELDHASFTYRYFENEGKREDRSLAANVTHSVDAFVLREMHRRCNYDREVVEAVEVILRTEMNRRDYGLADKLVELSDKVAYYQEQYNRSTLASAVILPHINEENVQGLSDEHLESLHRMVEKMLSHKSFPIVTVHDEFKAHPNNVNQVRFHYKEIMADIADSNLLDDLLSQIHGEPVTYDKLSFNLGDLIRKSDMALC